MAFYHHSLLVSAIRMLCEDEITNHGIDIADAMPVYVQYQRPYPFASWTTGSLFYINFVFEAMLAHLKCMFHGSQEIPNQLCRGVGAAQHTNQWIRRDVQGNKQHGYEIYYKANGSIKIFHLLIF